MGSALPSGTVHRRKQPRPTTLRPVARLPPLFVSEQITSGGAPGGHHSLGIQLDGCGYAVRRARRIARTSRCCDVLAHRSLLRCAEATVPRGHVVAALPLPACACLSAFSTSRPSDPPTNPVAKPGSLVAVPGRPGLAQKPPSPALTGDKPLTDWAAALLDCCAKPTNPHHDYRAGRAVAGRRVDRTERGWRPAAPGPELDYPR